MALAPTNFDPAILGGLTITELYNSEQAFCYLMNETDIATETCDGFNSICATISMYTNNAQGLKKYLQGLNKTFSTAPVALRVSYSPIAIERFTVSVWYFDNCVNGYHTLPDVGSVNTAFLDDLVDIYKEATNPQKDDSDEEEEAKVPELKGNENWVTFRDTFVLKMSNTKSARGFPMDYLLDTTPRAVTSNRGALIQVDIM